LCGYIERDDSNTISLVHNLFINTDKSRTRGIDIESLYVRPVTLLGGDERIRLRLLASYIDELSTQLAGAAKVDRVGQTGVGGGAADWQGSLSLGYVNGPFSGTWQGRYIASGAYNSTWQTGVDIDDNTIDSFFVSNLQLAYDGRVSSTASFQLWLNVSNLFDKDPPLVAQFGFTGSQATNSSLFDIYGRRYTMGVKFRF
jgi:hypothetical protein